MRHHAPTAGQIEVCYSKHIIGNLSGATAALVDPLPTFISSASPHFGPSWYGAAHNGRMHAAETRALADEMKEVEPKAIMLRIAVDYEKLAE